MYMYVICGMWIVLIHNDAYSAAYAITPRDGPMMRRHPTPRRRARPESSPDLTLTHTLSRVGCRVPCG